MKCKSSSLSSPQLWSWYPYLRSVDFFIVHKLWEIMRIIGIADPCLWEIMLHNSHAIDEHVLLKIFFRWPTNYSTRFSSKYFFSKSGRKTSSNIFLESEIRRRFRGCNRNHRGHSIKFMSDDDLTSRTWKPAIQKFRKFWQFCQKIFLDINLFFW